MNSKMKDNIKKRIQDYFNGQLPADKEAELVEWLKLKAENRELFQQVKANLDYQEMTHPLLEVSYTELQNKLFINQQINSKFSGNFRKIQRSILQIAAILLIGLVSGFSLGYLLQKPEQPGTEVAWFETHVSRGEKSQLMLPDGSKVWINSESNLSYPSNFMSGNRVIKLSGEAYFEVAKSDNKPFLVKTRDYDIRVLGTKFNVTAYADFKRTETSLIEGKIEILKGDKVFPAAPGQEITFINHHFSIKETNTNLSTKWKDDIFDFDKIPFKELIVRLERWYDVEIEIQNTELNDILYSGIFKNEETIWQVLNTFQLTIPIRYSRVGFRKFLIKPN
jgi:ferric-dicitrate binding protein FerR (iron transport regulator)